MPRGRPSSYTPQKAEAVCALVAEGASLRAIEAIDWMPSKFVILTWLQKHQEFAAQYARAKEAAADRMAEDIVAIADEPVPLLDNGAMDSAAVQRNRLRVDARKWVAAKLKPKKYGDASLLKLEGGDGGPVRIEVVRRADAPGTLPPTSLREDDEDDA